jgi:hypothetical protein
MTAEGSRWKRRARTAMVDSALIALSAVDVWLNLWDKTWLGKALALFGCAALAFRRHLNRGPRLTGVTGYRCGFRHVRTDHHWCRGPAGGPGDQPLGMSAATSALTSRARLASSWRTE